jgi:5'-3' exonuclease
MVKSGIAWACISDDMDMFLYGCNRVIRHISLLNHTAVLYDVDMILKDLKMREETFRQIMVLSGTDYNINMDTNLYETMKWFDEYNKYLLKNKDLSNKNFYEWLDGNTKYIKNKELLVKSYELFLIENYDFSDVPTEFIRKEINMEILKTILFKEGFIFSL